MLPSQQLELRLRSRYLTAEFKSHVVLFVVPRNIECRQLFALCELEEKRKASVTGCKHVFAPTFRIHASKHFYLLSVRISQDFRGTKHKIRSGSTQSKVRPGNSQR